MDDLPFLCFFNPFLSELLVVKCDRSIQPWMISRPGSESWQKNPAYGRHWISRPMLIETQIQKKTYKIFLLLRGMWLSGVGCSALYSKALVYIFIYWITYTFFICSALHWKIWKICVVSMHSNSIPWTHWTSPYSKLRIGSALQCTWLLCSLYSPLHCTIKFLNLLIL